MQALDLSQTRALRNLSALHDAGFLKLRKDGLWSLYSIDKDNTKEYLRDLVKVIQTALKGNPDLISDLAALAVINWRQ